MEPSTEASAVLRVFYVCHLNLCVGAILNIPDLSGINQIKLVLFVLFLNEAVSEQYFIPRL